MSNVLKRSSSETARYTECVCRVEMFILDLFHQWNGSEVDFLEGDRKDPSRTTLVSHSPSSAHQGMLSISPCTQKKITHLVSVCTNLDCMRVDFFVSICKTTSRFYRVMVSYNTLDTAVLTVGAFHQPSGELWQLPQVSWNLSEWSCFEATGSWLPVPSDHMYFV